MSFFLLFTFGFTIILTISANNWIAKESSCTFATTFVITDPADVNTVHTANAISLLSCSSWCCGLLASSFTYTVSTTACDCHDDTSISLTEDPSKASGIIYGQNKFGRQITKDGLFLRRHVTPERQDCQELYEEGFKTDGVYTIRPPEGAATDVWCDMADGGWTVISRRQDGSENFNRGRDDYEAGFGNRTGEYWLGLESIHLLTLFNTSVRVYVETFGDVSPTSMHANYSTFVVNDASTNYRLEIDGFTGDCGDSMAFHNGMQFTTFDNDNDLHSGSGNCAVDFPGGYWYNTCQEANPNGLYLGGVTDQYGKGMSWFKCWGHTYSPKIYVYKIKRN